jgi:hypothetical protein
MLRELQHSHLTIIYTRLFHLQYYTCATPPIATVPPHGATGSPHVAREVKL